MYSGRLELTWTNKHLRLLAHDDGSYEWVPPADHRIAEVRLLHDAATVGAVHDARARAEDNLLICGDALNALTSLVELPEFGREYVGKVKLAYLDPPFNTQQSFLHYDDALEHSVWLTMMRDRLVSIKTLLSNDGSVWVHCNDSEQAYLKVTMDEIFGRENFVASILWRKVDSPSDNNSAIAVNHDYILVFARNKSAIRFPQKPDPSILAAYPRTTPEGRRFRTRLLKKNGKASLRVDRQSMFFPVEAPDSTEVLPIHDDGREARWSAGSETVRSLISTGGLVWEQRPGHFEAIDPMPEDAREPRWCLRPEGERWVPYTVEWAPASDEATRPWPTIWTTSAATSAMALATEALDSEEAAELDPEGAIYRTLESIASIPVLDDVMTTRQAQAHLRALLPPGGFDTPKPEQLMRRVIEIASVPGDIVLDCFAGSGSTGTTAHKLGRRWVLIERDQSIVERFTLPRLTKVVAGIDPGGITTQAGWEGGGGFRVLDVAPSMFMQNEGLVFLSDWATNGKLAEATAAQLHFQYRYDPPFCGQQGRSRLAVIDGLVSTDVVKMVVQALAEDEQVTICGTAIDPDVHEMLRAHRPGSTARKIPQSILRDYQIAMRRTKAPPMADVEHDLAVHTTDVVG